MHVNTLRAVNFRCFKDLRVAFAPGFNLLIGDNQSGKTAILDALCIALSCFFQGFRTGVSLGIDKADVRLALQEIDGLVQMPAQYPVRIECQGMLGGSPIQWQRRLKGPSRRTSRALTELGRVAGALDHQMQAGEAVDLPVLAYFGTERIARERKTRPSVPDNIRDRSLGYKDCLERASSVRLVRGWMKKHTLANLQKGERGLPSAAKGQLKAIEAAVCRCVPEVTQFFFDLDHNDLAVVFQDGRRLPWSMLSDGVRSLATLAMDISWRAAVLNPHQGADAPQQATGTVLVDEVDGALHPNWQRRVVDALVRAFPKLQFIATTHSPQVIASAVAAQVQRIAGDQVDALPPVYGLDSNTVLVEVMGAGERSDEILQRIRAVNDRINERNYEAARQSLAELSETVGTLDTEVVRLRARIDFLSRAAAARS